MRNLHRDSHLVDIDLLEDLRDEVSAAKAESKELWEALARAKERETVLSNEQDEALKCVTQIEMDASLTQQKLDKALLELSQPVFVFAKEKSGKRSTAWSLKIVQLILEQLVAGVAPVSMGLSIVSFVRNICPNIKIAIKQLPSVWFIRQCRTVLLIVCQLLTAHRLSKSDKWGTMHTDGTARHHIDIINLIITILNDGGKVFANQFITFSDVTNKFAPCFFNTSILFQVTTISRYYFQHQSYQKAELPKQYMTQSLLFWRRRGSGCRNGKML